MNVLIISAHPDDEVLGIGGTVLRHVQHGDQVYVAMATDGCSGVYGPEKKQPHMAAMQACQKALGIREFFMLDFDNQKLDVTPILDMAGAIEKVIAQVKPERVYIHHHGDINQDHQALYHASIIATRPFANSFIREVYQYETLSSTEANFTPGSHFTPTIFIDIGPFVEQKIAAFSHYVTEMKPFPYPRSAEGIRTLAKYRGMQCGYEFAEAFALLWHRER